MATFALGIGNYVGRILVNIPEQATPITNDNFYQVPSGFYAIVTLLEHEGRGFNSGNNPNVNYNFIVRSFVDGGHYERNLLAAVGTTNFGQDLLINGDPAIRIRTYVDINGFRRTSGKASVSARLEEGDRIGFLNNQSFFAFSARITLDLYRYV